MYAHVLDLSIQTGRNQLFLAVKNGTWKAGAKHKQTLQRKQFVCFLKKKPKEQKRKIRVSLLHLVVHLAVSLSFPFIEFLYLVLVLKGEQQVVFWL